MNYYVKFGSVIIGVGILATYFIVTNTETPENDVVKAETVSKTVEMTKEVAPKAVETKQETVDPEEKAKTEPVITEKTQTVSVPEPAEVAMAQDAPSLYQSKGCVTCHGQGGAVAILDYPNLAGQNANYMVQQIEDILSGKRIGQKNDKGQPRNEIMRVALVNSEGVSSLSEQEIKDVSDWLTSLPAAAPVTPLAPITAERLAEGEKLYKDKKCQTCHGKEGMKPVNKAYPYLAGQKSGYLAMQMSDIKEKIRTSGKSKTMYPFVKKVTEDEMGLIADYLFQLDRSK